MANTPQILVVGLPAREELDLRSCLTPGNIDLLKIYPSIDDLVVSNEVLIEEFRRAVRFVFLDRTYDLGAKAYAPKAPQQLSPFIFQLEFALRAFPSAEVVCATNAPRHFKAEHQSSASRLADSRFLGTLPYVSLRRLSF